MVAHAALPPDLEAVLLDAGNTLLHVDLPYLARLAREHGHPLDLERLVQAEYGARLEMDRILREESGTTDQSRWARYFGAIFQDSGLSTSEFERLIPDLRRRHAEVGLWIRVMPGTRRALGHLRSLGFRLGVVSNSDGRIETWLRAKGLASSFEVVIDSHVAGVEKPDPRIFDMALGPMGVPPERALYVGDIYSVDVVGARRAGLTPVLLDPLDRYPANDCLRITGLDQLPRLLSTL